VHFRQLNRIRYAYPNTVMKNHLVGRGKYFKWKERGLKRNYCTERPRGRRDIIVTVSLLAPQNKPFAADSYEAQLPYRVGCLPLPVYSNR
jgi:hypothetical protein